MTRTVEHAPRTNTLSPVGSEPETSFIDASPQVKTAVATIMARMPLRFPAANGGRCERTNDPGTISPCRARVLASLWPVSAGNDGRRVQQNRVALPDWRERRAPRGMQGG